MPAPEAMLDLYLHLASASDEQRKPLQRDKFLVLSARIALKLGYVRIAEDCRQRVLLSNPSHILKNFRSIQEALGSKDLRQYANQLLRIYPFEKAEYLLQKYRAGGYSGDHGYSEINAIVRPGSPGKVRERKSDEPRSRLENNVANGHKTRKREVRPPAKPVTNGVRPSGNGNGAGPRSALETALQNASARRPVRALPADLDCAPLPLELPAPPRPFATIPWANLNWTFLSWLVIAFATGMAACGVIIFAVSAR